MNDPRKKVSKKPFAWTDTKEVQALVKALGETQMRFVGGAVRDSLLGRPIGDIDVATKLEPEEVMKTLGKKNFKVVPTGLDHGTVTAVISGQTFEITTLRHDVKTHGRRAEVAFHDDWEADAKRRDFTINAIYLSPDGNIFDYFEGEADIKAGIIRFIGNPDARIKEDGLRIIRLFRFHAWFGKEDLKNATLAAVKENLALLSKLSAERIQTEILKILEAPDPGPDLRLMEKTGVLAKTFSGLSVDLVALENLVDVENALGVPSEIRRLGALFEGQAGAISNRLKLSNKIRERLSKMEQEAPDNLGEKSIRATIYRCGLETFQDIILLSGLPVNILADVLKIAREFSVPEFPVTGRDLEGLGIPPGIGMGVKLQELESQWVDSDFSLTKEELLNL